MLVHTASSIAFEWFVLTQIVFDLSIQHLLILYRNLVIRIQNFSVDTWFGYSFANIYCINCAIALFSIITNLFDGILFKVA